MSERKTSEAQLRAVANYRAKHKEYYRELTNKYMKANPEKNRANVARFRTRQKIIKQEFKELAAIDCF